jgi:hypothetical protein
LTVWLAFIALTFQLATAGSCAARMDNSAAAVPMAFPICHAQSADQDPRAPDTGDHSQNHRGDCPLCSIHCHAAFVLSPTFVAATPVAAASITMRKPLVAGLCRHHIYVGASPRGPPTA